MRAKARINTCALRLYLLRRFVTALLQALLYYRLCLLRALRLYSGAALLLYCFTALLQAMPTTSSEALLMLRVLLYFRLSVLAALRR
jgi:hypothetical protein